MCTPLVAQYYLRGEIKDEKNTPLSNAKILLHSTGYLYYSGSSGGFGIVSSKPSDSITVSIDGFVSYSTRIYATRFHSIVLKMMYTAATVQKNRLLSFTSNLKLEDRNNWNVGTETYSSLVENEFVPARRYPETGFAIHSDRASYSNIRRFLNMRVRQWNVPALQFLTEVQEVERTVHVYHLWDCPALIYLPVKWLFMENMNM